jgi:2-dehydropantoate 2-reductase
MRILVLGAGGVGGYLAGVMTKEGMDVTLFATKNTNNYIKQSGLIIKDVDGEFVVYPKTDLDGVYDVVIVATKSYHLKEIFPILKDYTNKKTVVLPLLNGVGHFEKLKDFNVKKGCIYIVSHKIDTNIIHKKADTFYLCYEKDALLDELFSKLPLKVKSSKKIDFDIWKKYLFIATFATLTSYYGRPMGWVVEQKEEEVKEFVKRMVLLANQNGIAMDAKQEIEKVLKQAKNIPYDSKTSMQIDFENKNETELENLVGYLKNDEFISKFYQKLK